MHHQFITNSPDKESSLPWPPLPRGLRGYTQCWRGTGLDRIPGMITFWTVFIVQDSRGHTLRYALQCRHLCHVILLVNILITPIDHGPGDPWAPQPVSAQHQPSLSLHYHNIQGRQEFKTAGRHAEDAMINAWNIWPSAHTSPPMIVKILCWEPSVKSLVMLVNVTDVRRQLQIVKSSLKSNAKIADTGLTVLSLVNLPIALGKPSL